jgi:ribonuclease HI
MAKKVYGVITPDFKAMYYDWNEVTKVIKGKASKYKGFKTEKEAFDWLAETEVFKWTETASKGKESLPKTKLRNDCIYFDAGTGRGIGVEVRVTDVNGKSLLANKVNEYGNYLMPEGSTNNMGELTGLFYALDVAIKNDNILYVAGDSKLVIDYWSKGICKVDDPKVQKAVRVVTKLRTIFESKGGSVVWISGDINPADLGFHK